MSDVKPTVRHLHTVAMDNAQAALLLCHAGSLEQAREHFLKAYQLEREAAERIKVGRSREPTRSILYRSAATLALDAGLIDEAIALVTAGRTRYTHAEIDAELVEVWERAVSAKAEQDAAGKLGLGEG